LVRHTPHNKLNLVFWLLNNPTFTRNFLKNFQKIFSKIFKKISQKIFKKFSQKIFKKFSPKIFPGERVETAGLVLPQFGVVMEPDGMASAATANVPLNDEAGGVAEADTPPSSPESIVYDAVAEAREAQAANPACAAPPDGGAGPRVHEVQCAMAAAPVVLGQVEPRMYVAPADALTGAQRGLVELVADHKVRVVCIQSVAAGAGGRTALSHALRAHGGHVVLVYPPEPIEPYSPPAYVGLDDALVVPSLPSSRTTVVRAENLQPDKTTFRPNAAVVLLDAWKGMTAPIVTAAAQCMDRAIRRCAANQAQARVPEGALLILVGRQASPADHEALSRNLRGYWMAGDCLEDEVPPIAYSIVDNPSHIVSMKMTRPLGAVAPGVRRCLVEETSSPAGNHAYEQAWASWEAAGPPPPDALWVVPSAADVDAVTQRALEALGAPIHVFRHGIELFKDSPQHEPPAKRQAADKLAMDQLAETHPFARARTVAKGCRVVLTVALPTIGVPLGARGVVAEVHDHCVDVEFVSLGLAARVFAVAERYPVRARVVVEIANLPLQLDYAVPACAVRAWTAAPRDRAACVTRGSDLARREELSFCVGATAVHVNTSLVT
jgi:hypothetical protein